MKIEFTETRGDEGSFTLHTRWGTPFEREQVQIWAAAALGFDDPRPMPPRAPEPPRPPPLVQNLANLGAALLRLQSHSEKDTNDVFSFNVRELIFEWRAGKLDL